MCDCPKLSCKQGCDCEEAGERRNVLKSRPTWQEITVPIRVQPLTQCIGTWLFNYFLVFNFLELSNVLIPVFKLICEVNDR